MGYDGSQAGSSSDEKDKLVIELRQRVETLDQALHACKGSNQFFKDKIQVLEGSPTQEKSWFEGHKVHNMYQRQAKGKAKPTKLEKRLKTIQVVASMGAHLTLIFACIVAVLCQKTGGSGSTYLQG